MTWQERLIKRFSFLGRRTAAPTKIAGGPETIIYSGYISPREKNPKLYGREKFRTYNQNLANISIVAAGVRYFLNIVSKAKWAVEDPTEASTDQKTKSGLILEMMHDMDVPWHRVVRRQAMYRFLDLRFKNGLRNVAMMV